MSRPRLVTSETRNRVRFTYHHLRSDVLIVGLALTTAGLLSGRLSRGRMRARIRPRQTTHRSHSQLRWSASGVLHVLPDGDTRC